MNNKKTVIIAEDEKNTRRLMAEVLTEKGYLVSEAENARRALELISTNCPDALITDYSMPPEIMDGIDLIEEIRSRKDNYPIIFHCKVEKYLAESLIKGYKNLFYIGKSSTSLRQIVDKLEELLN